MTEFANKIGIRIHSPSWRRLARSARRPPGHDELRRTMPNPRWSRAELLIGISASGRSSCKPDRHWRHGCLLEGGEPVVKHDAAPGARLVSRRMLDSRRMPGVSRWLLGRRRRCDRLGLDRVELGLGIGAAVGRLRGFISLAAPPAPAVWRTGRRTAPARQPLRCRRAQPSRRGRRSDRQARPGTAAPSRE